MDYMINFVREFERGIVLTSELLGILETDVINIQKTIDENQKNLPLLQLAHYIKYYFVGLFDNLSVIEKRLREISEFRKLSQKLPFRVIVKILQYFQVNYASKFKVTDFYCYFAFDPFRKIFQVFLTNSYEFKKELPISTTTLSLSNDSKFEKYVKNFPNLTHLDIGRGTPFPTELHPQSCRSITHVEISEFDHKSCEGLKSCHNLEELIINRIINPPDSSVFICTDFPKLKELTFYNGLGLNRIWEFHKLKSIQRLVICNTSHPFSRSEVVVLMTSCTLLDDLEIGRYEEGLDFPYLYLFFMYGYSLKRIDFYNLNCDNWSRLNEFEPTDQFKVEDIVVANPDCESYFTPIPLFDFACKYFSETLKVFGINLPREGESSHTGVLDDLSPITRLKKLENVQFIHSLHQTSRSPSTNDPISLDFCCESLDNLSFQSILGNVEEYVCLGDDPSKFAKLTSILFENYEGGDCVIHNTFISACLTLPALTEIDLRGGIVDCPNWYELLMIPSIKEVHISLLEKKYFVDYSMTRQEAETNEKDLKFSELFKIPEHSSLQELVIDKGENYPWSFIYEITRMCRKLENLTLNERVSFKPGGNHDELLEEKYAEMKVYVYKNMISLPKLETLCFNLPESTMANREFGRQNMFSFSISSERFIQHRAKEMKILQKYNQEKKQEEEEETEGEDQDQEMNKMKKSMQKKGQELFLMKSVAEEEYSNRLELFTHAMHAVEMKEITSIFGKIDTLQIMMLPKPILLRILNEFYELTIKQKHWEDLSIKSLYGYFRWDKDREIKRVFSCIHFLRCGRKMDEFTPFCKYQNLRFEYQACSDSFFDQYNPLGRPKMLMLKKGSTEPFFVDRKKKKKKNGEEKGEQMGEEMMKNKKLMYSLLFSQLERLSFVDVVVTLDFFRQLVSSGGLRKRIRSLEFVYCKLSSQMLELFLDSSDESDQDDDDWGQLKVFKIVQYGINPHLVERLKSKFPFFSHVKFTGKKKPKKKKKKKKKE